MHRLRLLVAGALVAGTMAFASASPAGAVVYTTCSGTSGDVTISPGTYWELQKPANFATTSGATTCVGTGTVTAANWSVTFGGFFGNCNTLMGDRGSNSVVTVNWTAPAGMGSSTGRIAATVASRTADTTTLTFTGRFHDKAGMLYRNQPLSGSVVFNKSFLSPGSGGDCTITVPITVTGGGAATALTVGT